MAEGGGAVVVPEPSTPELTPPPPLPPPPPCIPIHGGDCVTAQVFEQSADALVDDYNQEDGFKNQWGLEHMNAGLAYANIELLKGADAKPGSGVTIGFIDTGIDQSHPMFAGKTFTEQFLSGAPDETGTRFSHGTGVASIAAGAQTADTVAPQGVAWGADIAMFSITAGSGGGNYNPISLAGLASNDATWAARFTEVLAWRDGTRKVDILNLSVGHSGIINSYSRQNLRDNFSSAIAAIAQAGAGEKTVFVWAAGNAHGDPCDSLTTDHCENDKINAVSVEVLPGLVRRIPELRGHSIAVVALNPDGEIASFSNRCGIAANHCIAAPGESVRVAYFGPNSVDEVIRGYAAGRGTSYAAPMAAGGLALMKQLFRDQLSNTELVTRLFDTADNTGIYTDSAIYGQGPMDLGAATSPVGVLEVPGTNAVSSGLRLQSARLRPGAAFGDGLERSLAAHQIMALDDLGAPFWYRLGDFTAAASSAPVAARLRGFLAPEPAWRGLVSVTALAGSEGVPAPETAPLSVQVARLESPAEIRGSHFALAEGGVKATLAGHGGLSATAFTTNGIPGQKPAIGAALSWRRAGLPLWGFGPAGSASARPSWGASPKALSAPSPVIPPSWAWMRVRTWAGGGSGPTRSSAWSPRPREAASSTGCPPLPPARSRFMLPGRWPVPGRCAFPCRSRCGWRAAGRR